MFRKLAIAAGLSAASLIAFVPAASAQGITLSIGSGGGYSNGYGYPNAYPGYAYTYSAPQNYGYYPSYGYNGYGYGDRRYERAQRRRAEQLERWQRERARREYWRHEQRENRDRDDD